MEAKESWLGGGLQWRRHGCVDAEGEGVGGYDIKAEAAIVDRGHRCWFYHVV